MVALEKTIVALNEAVPTKSLQANQPVAAGEADTKRKPEQLERQLAAVIAAAEEKREASKAEGINRQGWIGVRVQQVSNTNVSNLGMNPARGVQVVAIDDMGPAKLAGIEQGDLIIKFDGHEINEVRDVPRIVAETPIDKNVQVVIIRSDKEYTKTLKIAVLPPEVEAKRKAKEAAREATKQGYAAFNSGDTDRAISDFNEAIRLDSEDPTAFNGRAIAYSRKGNTDRAIADYNEAVRLNPQLAGAFNGRGNAYSKKGDTDRAIADYNEAIRLDPNYADAFCNRGYLKLKMNDASGGMDIAKAKALANSSISGNSVTQCR